MAAAQHALRLLASGPLAAAGRPMLTQAASCLLCQSLGSAKQSTADPSKDHQVLFPAALAAAHHSSEAAPGSQPALQSPCTDSCGCSAGSGLEDHSRLGGAEVAPLTLAPDRWGGSSAPHNYLQPKQRQQVWITCVRTLLWWEMSVFAYTLLHKAARLLLTFQPLRETCAAAGEAVLAGRRHAATAAASAAACARHPQGSIECAAAVAGPQKWLHAPLFALDWSPAEPLLVHAACSCCAALECLADCVLQAKATSRMSSDAHDLPREFHQAGSDKVGIANPPCFEPPFTRWFNAHRLDCLTMYRFNRCWCSAGVDQGTGHL